MVKFKMNWGKDKSKTVLMLFAGLMSILLVGSSIFIISLGRQSVLNETNIDDTDIDRTYNYYYDSDQDIMFTDIMFVHIDGDNTTGDTWDTAYKSLHTALTLASNDSNDYTLIKLGSGDQDMDQIGNPTYDCNVMIQGDDRPNTRIINNNALALSVIKFTGNVLLDTIIIDCGDTNGVIFAGEVCKIENSLIQADSATANAIMVDFQASVSSITIDKVDFIGSIYQNYTTSLRMEGISFSRIQSSNFWFGLKGLDIINSNYLEFRDISYSQIYTAINIDTLSTNLFFTSSYLRQNTHNINDSSSSAFFCQSCTILDQEVSYLIPPEMTGTTLTGGAAAEEWGSWVNITDSSTITKPFKIRAVIVDSTDDVNTMYQGQISIFSNGEYNYFDTSLFHGGLKESTTYEFVSGILPAGAIISTRIRSENGGSDSCNIHISVVEY